MKDFSLKPLLRLAVSLTAVISLIGGCDAGGSDDKKKGSDEKEEETITEAKYVMLFIGDGMPLEAERGASFYLTGVDNGLSFQKWGSADDEYKGSVTTWDVSAYNNYAFDYTTQVTKSDGVSKVDAPAKEFAGQSYQLSSFNGYKGYDPLKGGKLPWPLDKSVDELAMKNYYQVSGADTPWGKNSLSYASSKKYSTDSASAGTAMACGVKTDDGNVAWQSGDGSFGSLKTIAETLREMKKFSIGVASTVPFNHATPACFVAHNISRNNYTNDKKDAAAPTINGYNIAEEILTLTKPEVVIGAGYNSTSYMTASLLETVKADSEYVTATRAAGISGKESLASAAADAAKNGKKLLGLYGDGTSGQFEYHTVSDTPGSPSVTQGSSENPWLKDIVTSSLDVLATDEDGFFVMFEQGDIDWADHANNYASMVGGVYDLDEAVKSAVAYVDKEGDEMTWENTLIIVTSDHSNSYIRLKKDLAKGDLPAQNKYTEKGTAGAAAKETGTLQADGLTYKFTDSTTSTFKYQFLNGDVKSYGGGKYAYNADATTKVYSNFSDKAYQFGSAGSYTYAGNMYNFASGANLAVEYEYDASEIVYSTSEHTNEPVMIYAKGKGAELFKEYEGKNYPEDKYAGVTLIDNTDIYRVMGRSTGILDKEGIVIEEKKGSSKK